jgi:hypothetical protein
VVIRVANDRQLEAAVVRLLESGGTIVLAGNRYHDLVVPVRPGAAPRLEIAGPRSARIEHVLLDGTAGVALTGMTIEPRSHDATVEIRHSKAVKLERVLVTAQGTRYSATVVAQGAQGLTVRESEFTHCGDRSSAWTNCLRLFERSSDVVIERSWFHDCYGCDFIHGRPGSGLVVRRSRFERALPCRMGGERCGHQDLVELFAGRWLTFDGNYFGVYRRGGAQLYLTGDVDHVSITNNVFVGTDPWIPGYRARVALIVGSKGKGPLPLHVTIANNTILTGARRDDGYAGSLRMNSLYRGLPESARPVVANNVISLLSRRRPVCTAVQLSVSNVVISGRRCSVLDRIGDPHLDATGRPTRQSILLIDRATRRFAPVRDANGQRRGRSPDIGAFEYRELG